jgi:large subunit ribosomal protein L32e
MRRRISGRPPLVSVGYRSPAAARGLHPSGLSEVLIHTHRELEGVDPQRQAVRIAAGVGRRLRERIMARAEELGIRILNPRRSR